MCNLLKTRYSPEKVLTGRSQTYQLAILAAPFQNCASAQNQTASSRLWLLRLLLALAMGQRLLQVPADARTDRLQDGIGANLPGSLRQRKPNTCKNKGKVPTPGDG